jgi:hypothetical protein
LSALTHGRPPKPELRGHRGVEESFDAAGLFTDALTPSRKLATGCPAAIPPATEIDMRIPSARLLLFNAAAILVAVAAVVALLRSILIPSSLAACSGRYGTSMAFPLERDGVMVTATDIQARVGSAAAAIVDNLRIVRLTDGPAPVGMSIALPKGSSAPNTAAVEKGGVSFPWQPRSLRKQAAVCLSYSILLPADFNFGSGGALPGIIGQTDNSGDRFLVQAAWHRTGDIGATSLARLAGKESKQTAESGGVQLPRGRWAKLEQEVVLNEAGHDNGIVRIWVDGALVVDRGDLTYRAKGDVGLAGVAADVFYSGDDRMSRSPADAKVLLSPFEIRWK